MQATELNKVRQPYHIMHKAQRTRKERKRKEGEGGGGGGEGKRMEIIGLVERSERTRHIDSKRREESDIHFFLFQPSSVRLLLVRTDRFVSGTDGRRKRVAYVTITAGGYVQYGTEEQSME